MTAAGDPASGYRINGRPLGVDGYRAYHERRFARTIETLGRLGAKRIIEIGAHPWVLTAKLVEDPRFQLVATVSAEEVSAWPDEIPLRCSKYEITTPSGRTARFSNYSANVERTLFCVEERADTVVASEIVEHLIRAPHVMFLNVNRWLPIGGHLLVTTPNGAQFANPFRRRSQTPAYRSSVYERHTYLYVLDDLVELVELCGFAVVDRGYWEVYKRGGAASFAYDLLARVPHPYFAAKFKKTIYLVARKIADVDTLTHAPRVYDSRGSWERIAPSTA